MQLISCICGRGDRIRTCDIYVPNVALYQSELHPGYLNSAAEINRFAGGPRSAVCDEIGGALVYGVDGRQAIKSRIADALE